MDHSRPMEHLKSKKRSRVIPIFVVLLLVSLLSGFAVGRAQDEARLPDLLLPWSTNIYSSISSPMTLTIAFSTVDMDKYTKPSISPASANQVYSDETDDTTNTVTMHWQPRTNSSTDWTIDLFMNYTTSANRAILIGTTSVDSDGNPMNTGPFSYMIPDAQNVWVRILITTRAAPHYPTPQELDTSRDPNHPTNVRLTNLETAINGGNGQWGLKFTITIQTIVIVIQTIAILALAGFIVFVLRHQGA